MKETGLKISFHRHSKDVRANCFLRIFTAHAVHVVPHASRVRNEHQQYIVAAATTSLGFSNFVVRRQLFFFRYIYFSTVSLHLAKK